MNTNKTCSCCSVSRTDISQTNHSIAPSDYWGGKIRFKDKMVYISGGDFLMGTDDEEGFPSDREGPVRNVKVEPFYIDNHTVTNKEFKQFVEETNYQTVAEKFGWSFVFHEFLTLEQLNNEKQLQNVPWWYAVRDAFWYQPEGSGSTIEQRLDHPVLHVSWHDANTFCEWAGKRLPTEIEWEFAARGGLEQKKYPWGDELTPDEKHYCNIWQGKFPQYNSKEDGYLGTAPAKSFPPNNYGLYNMSGNVWEWCSDWFNKDIEHSTQKSMRGGSYLCHKSYCNRYRVAARSSNTMDSSSGNIGFRCVSDV
ncbi:MULTISPECIES: formylglycine-generating enzyme family protein [Oceanobacillus]|uniref:Formylglycine-generating enzyme family protein n=2 Tax=Oceanobacillus profundus TaxID=372463 RepID=A0A417YCJ7_9BACI|nr:formylglycine-generating enzyme family protein [Oceanobacillus profundus]